MAEPTVAPAEKDFKPLSDEAYNNLIQSAKVETPKENPVNVKPLSEKEKPENKNPETPVEKKDEKPVDEVKPPEEIKPKKLRERMKGDFPSKEKTAPKPEEINVTELQKKISDYEKEINDSDYQTYKAIKAKGKKSIDILQEVMGVNPDKMSDEEVFRHDLTKAGITDPEKVQNEMELFFGEGTSERVRKKELAQLRNGMRREVDNVQSEFFNKLTAPDPQQIEKNRIENERIQKDAESFQNRINDSIGKEELGLKVTADMAKNIAKRIENNELIPKRDDGSIDSDKLYRMLLFSEYEDAIWDNVEQTNYAEGVHKIADEVEATPASRTISSRPPDIQHKLEKGSEEWADKTSKNLVPYTG